VLTKSALVNSFLSLSNNSLTAPPRTPAAMVDPWTWLSNTLKPTPSRLKMLIHTLLKMDNANQDKESSVLLTTLMYLPMTTPNCSLMPKSPPSPLLLRLTKMPSKDILVESSTAKTAEPSSITEYSSSDTEMMEAKTTGLSRTHGVLPGEKVDSSELLMSQVQVSAVSTWLLSAPPLELLLSLTLNKFI